MLSVTSCSVASHFELYCAKQLLCVELYSMPFSTFTDKAIVCHAQKCCPMGSPCVGGVCCPIGRQCSGVSAAAACIDNCTCSHMCSVGQRRSCRFSTLGEEAHCVQTLAVKAAAPHCPSLQQAASGAEEQMADLQSCCCCAEMLRCRPDVLPGQVRRQFVAEEVRPSGEASCQQERF